MKVEVKVNFWDVEKGVQRKKGDKFECSEKRGKALLATGKVSKATAEKKAAPKTTKKGKPEGAK